MSNLAINDAGEVLAFDGKAWKPAQMAENDAGQRLVFDGAAWQPLDKIVGQSKGGQAQGRSDALAGAVASGATFGTADEIGASVRAALPGFSNWMMSKSAFERSLDPNAKSQTVSSAATYEQRREEELARMRAQSAANKEAYPTLMTAGEIGGNVLGTAALSMVPGARALVTGGGGSGLVANSIRGGLTGMALGGAQGFAEGEGGFENRARNAVLPAMFGGAVGAAAPTVAKGVGYVYDRAAPPLLRWLADKADDLAPRVSGRSQSLSAAAPDDGPGIIKDSWLARASESMSNKADSIDEQVANKYLSQVLRGRNSVDATEAAINRPGGDWMIADANKATKRAAFSTQANSDDAAQLMSERFLERNQRAGTTFKQAVPGAPDPARAEDFLAAYKTAEGSKIYDPVLRGNQPVNISPEMEALMQRPSIKKAFDTVDEWAAEEGRRFTQAERLHMVKQALNANAQAKMGTGGPVNKNLVNNTANEWEQALWNANKGIKDADAAYAKIAGLHEDWFKRGQSFAARGRGEAAQNASPEALAEVLRGATPQQRQVFQAGVAAEMRRIASDGGAATRRLAKVLGDGEEGINRLTEALGPERAQAVLQSGNARLAQAETFTDVMRGSPTAERTMALARDADLMPPAGGDATSLLRWLRDTAAKLDTPTEAGRRRLAEILTTMDKEEQRAALAAIRQLQQQQRTQTFKPGVTGSAAATMTPSDR